MNIKTTLLFLCLLSLLCLGAYGQEVPATDDEIIRISSKLVLVDALVVDKENRQVKDLQPEDFEVYQDGKKQEITAFSYVDGAEGSVKAATRKAGTKDIPLPPMHVRNNDFGRVISFVIDDGNCLASIQGIANARDSIKRFVREQMRPDDKVAIYRTRAGASLLQLYTSNKEVLIRDLNKVKWFPQACNSAFEAARDKSTLKASGQGASSFESEEDKATKKSISEIEQENSVIGSIGVLGFVADRLRPLPNRKLVFFISEGIPTAFGTRAYDTLRMVSDRASRASVVVYSVSARGTSIPGFMEAQDEVLPGISGGVDETFALVESRLDEERLLNEGMAYIAYSTGGKFLRNQNDLEIGIEKVLEAETGYYLIGYEPETETFDGKEYHKIEIRLKRPELTIGSRRGFIGVEERPTVYQKAKGKSPVYAAIASPFAESTLEVRLTPIPNLGKGKQKFIRAMFHIDGSRLTFSDEPGGMKKVVLNVVMVAMDEKSDVIEEFNRVYPIRIPERGLETVRQNGLDYIADLPIKKDGFVSLRAAVMDEGSGRIGSASDYVDMPKLGSNDFFVTGLVTTYLERQKPFVPAERPVDAGFAPVFNVNAPTVREYTAGSPVPYLFDIYNPRIDRSSGKPNLSTSYRLFRDGDLVRESGDASIAADRPGPDGRLEKAGVIVLGADDMPGEYILQLTVTDRVRGESRTRWIDFQVVN